MPQSDQRNDQHNDWPNGVNPGGPDPDLIPDHDSNAELHLGEAKRHEAAVEVSEEKVRAAQNRRAYSEGPIDESTPEKVEEARRNAPVNRSAIPPAKQTTAVKSETKTEDKK